MSVERNRQHQLMAKIRDLALTDIPKINKLMSFLDVSITSVFDGVVLPCPLNWLYKLLPLRFKFLPESYVFTDKNNIFASISVKKNKGNHRKWQISKLFMTESAYEAGLILIQYVVSKFSAKGATSFFACIDETQNELIKLFADGAGFRQCSRHQIWKCNNYTQAQTGFEGFSMRPFKNSDAKNVAELYNDTLQTHFRPSLSNSKKEFFEDVFAGLRTTSSFRFVLEDRNSKNIIAFFKLKTSDNKSFLMDALVSKGYEHLYENILNYGLYQAQKRTQNPEFYVINRHYLQTASAFDEILKLNGYQASNSSVLLVKDIFRTVQNEELSKQAVFYTDIGSNPAFKSQLF